MSERIAAVVVTHNRKVMLGKCLAGLLEQTFPLYRIIVVDNASTDGTAEMFAASGAWGNPLVEYCRLTENMGGAGGFHEGVKRAYEEGHDWVWLMDDDAVPNSDALRELLGHSEAASILVSTQINNLGRMYGASTATDGWFVPLHLEPGFVLRGTAGFAFVGPLISRRCIATVGLPRADLFIMGDDTEYALRLGKAGFSALIVERSIIFHECGQKSVIRRFMWRSRAKPCQPNWKYYYFERNWMFISRSYARRKNMAIIRILGRLCWTTFSDLAYEPERALPKLFYRTIGIADALRGRLGKRFTA